MRQRRPAERPVAGLRLLTPCLVGICFVVAIVTSLGAPLVPSVAAATHVSLATAQWMLTAALLTGALATPILGHLSDGDHQRVLVLVTLAVVLAGCLLAVFARNFPQLVVARGLQGTGFGVIAVSMSIARRHQAAERARRTVAVLSITTTVGVGLGYPIAGLLDTVAGYRSTFWLGVGVAGVVLVLSWFILPAAGRDHPSRIDRWSAVLLVVSLSGVILTLSDGQQWGWTSPTTLAVGIGALTVLVVWITRELGANEPIVALRLLARRGVLSADISVFLVSLTMYLYMPIVVDVVQQPSYRGVGLGHSALVAGCVFIPMSACTVIASVATPSLTRLVSVRGLVPLGGLIFAIAMSFFAVWHDAVWQAFASMALLGLGCGLTFAAMPRMIVDALPPEVTGHAMGLYQVLRSIGMTAGSALGALVLSAHTAPGDLVPSEAGDQASLLTGAALCLLTGAVSYGLAAPAGNREASRRPRAQFGPQVAGRRWPRYSAPSRGSAAARSARGVPRQEGAGPVEHLG
jgi:predicted MFS family arabinose efflux permease